MLKWGGKFLIHLFMFILLFIHSCTGSVEIGRHGLRAAVGDHPHVGLPALGKCVRQAVDVAFQKSYSYSYLIKI